MELNEKEKINIKDRLIYFFNTNKIKVYVSLLLLTIILVFVPIIKYKINQQNINIAENYIQAGLYLSSGEKKKSIGVYEKIIYSGNKFYSVLALNKILEKDLVKDDKKIFELNQQYNFHYLSLGMSNDYLSAIKYGASHVRIGSSIFGARS